jgi:hypothetical protein
MTERLPAALVAAVCLLLLVRMMLGARLRQRVDTALRATWHVIRSRASWVWHWRARRNAARRAAEETIRRAQRGVQRDGNVYKPKSFREPRKPH